jgi:tRNA(fMet)-specific endonuclease VapC
MGNLRVCIDTNVYSAFKKGEPNTIELLEKADEVLIPSVVLGELYAGFYLGKRLKKNLKELDEFLKYPGIDVININSSIAERHGILIKTLKELGAPIPTNDVWIAATVLETGARLASFDNHFRIIPGILLIFTE